MIYRDTDLTMVRENMSVTATSKEKELSDKKEKKMQLFNIIYRKKCPLHRKQYTTKQFRITIHIVI